MTIRQTDRAFGLTFAAVFVIIAGILWWVSESLVLWPFIVSASFTGVALVAPGLLLPLNRLWALFGSKLGAFNNNLILGLFYILFVIPFGFCMHLFGRDPLKQKTRPETGTYWSTPPRQLDRDTLKDMY